MTKEIYRKKVYRKKLIVQMPEEMYELLNKLTEKLGLSRSEIVRFAIFSHFKHELESID